MIEQLPIINLLLLLSTALLIPLFKRKTFAVTLTLNFLVLLTVWISSLILLYHVNTVDRFIIISADIRR